MKIYVEEEPWEELWPEAEFVAEQTRFYEYSFKDYSIYLYKDGRKPSCTCKHGSHWGRNKPFEYCYHIETVKEAIKQRGGFTWERQEKLV